MAMEHTSVGDDRDPIIVKQLDTMPLFLPSSAQSLTPPPALLAQSNAMRQAAKANVVWAKQLIVG
uniref:hypothetical protein n=1 Tax=Pseudomonas fluorescens TaxID=294 RepID=UPI00130D8311|nr:hypothetical protein [Pseudomonas fluorescens]